MEGTVKERLVKYLKFKHIGQNRFESMAGISNGYISNLKSSPGASHLTKIIKAAPDLSRSWLLTGEGEMINKSFRIHIDPDEHKKNLEHTRKMMDMLGETLEFVTENKNQAQFFRDETGELRISVPHVPYAARAEFANYSDRLEKESETWSREMYQVDKIVHGTYFSFDVKGESMDDGSRESLQDGDKVLVRELERDFWKDIRTGDHRYWVIVNRRTCPKGLSRV